MAQLVWYILFQKSPKAQQLCVKTGVSLRFGHSVGIIGAADGAGGVGGVPPLSSPRHTPGMKPDKEGFIGESDPVGWP